MNKTQKEIYDLIKELQLEETHEIETTISSIRESSTEEILTKEDGYIEVRDRQLFIIDALENGKSPMLIPNENLYITVNGTALKKELVVFEKDKIEWVVEKKTPYQITISEDKLKVYLQVFPELFIDYRLKDKKRSLRFQLEVESFHSPCDVEEMSSKILEDITKRGVKIEVKTSTIMQEIIKPTFNKLLVAEGLPLIPSRDGYVEKFFSTEVEEIIDEKDGKVNYKNRIKIPTVEAGAVIAQIHPPKEGKEGLNVLGQTLLPKKAKRVDIRAKSSVQITDEGKVIALTSGRPSVTGHYVKHINILETYEINGNVDMSTGNIFFNGDIIIRGHVNDHMRVESSGSIYIFGNVYHATVTASQHVYIYGNIINSHVNAGQFGLFYSRVYKISQALLLSINQLQAALKQIQKAMATKGLTTDFGYILSTLVDTKFKNIREEVLELYKTIKETTENQMALPPQLKIISNSLSLFKDHRSIRSIQSEQAVQSIVYALNELIQQMESIILDESTISFHSANSSQVRTNGEITVLKEGVINTTLFSGKSITFRHSHSVIRGGKIEALEAIQAGLVGTEFGQPPELYAGERVSIAKLYHARIKFPHKTIVMEEEMDQLELLYNSKTNKLKSNKSFLNLN